MSQYTFSLKNHDNPADDVELTGSAKTVGIVARAAVKEHFPTTRKSATSPDADAAPDADASDGLSI